MTYLASDYQTFPGLGELHYNRGVTRTIVSHLTDEINYPHQGKAVQKAAYRIHRKHWDATQTEPFRVMFRRTFGKTYRYNGHYGPPGTVGYYAAIRIANQPQDAVAAKPGDKNMLSDYAFHRYERDFKDKGVPLPAYLLRVYLAKERGHISIRHEWVNICRLAEEKKREAHRALVWELKQPAYQEADVPF